MDGYESASGARMMGKGVLRVRAVSEHEATAAMQQMLQPDSPFLDSAPGWEPADLQRQGTQ
eukprot:scaffold655911_cov211-Prasinocladus_malaysianus.AAC.1